MASWRDFLLRFRPAGVAGAAAPAGVPADRMAEARAELAPVFDLLADTERDVAALREAGVVEARRRVERARRQARDIVAEARVRAPAVRAEAAASAGTDTDLARGDAVDSTVLIREHAARVMPALVERAVAVAIRGITGESP